MKNIKFTGAFWHEIKEKVNIYKELKKLLSSFDLSPYNNDSFDLFIVFQAFPKDYPARKVLEYKIQRRKTKTLELYLVLDYERIMQGSDEENLNLIKEVFVKGCETFLKPMKGFRWEEFEEQLKQIL